MFTVISSIFYRCFFFSNICLNFFFAAKNLRALKIRMQHFFFCAYGNSLSNNCSKWRNFPAKNLKKYRRPKYAYAVFLFFFQCGMFRILCLSCLLNYIVIWYKSINLMSFAVLFCDLHFQSKIFQSTYNKRKVASIYYIRNYSMRKTEFLQSLNYFQTEFMNNFSFAWNVYKTNQTEQSSHFFLSLGLYGQLFS